jgi:hypothetical protein
MFYVLIELRNYRQLQKIAPDTAETADSSIKSLLSPLAESTEQASGYYLYHFTSRNTADIEKMASAVHSLHKQLQEIHTDLLLYSILLETYETDDALIIFRQMRNFLLEHEQENQFWIGSSAKTAVEYLFQYEHFDDGSTVVIDAAHKQKNDSGFPDFSLDPEIEKTLKRVFRQYFTNVYQPAVHWVQASKPIDLFYTLSNAGKSVLASDFPESMMLLEIDDQAPYINILGIDPHYRPIHQLSEITQPQLCGVLYEKAHEFLDKELQYPLAASERPLITAQRRILSIIQYRMQLAEYHGKPLICAIMTKSTQNKTVRNLISAISTLLLERTSGIPVIISPEEAGSLAGLPCIACTPLDHERLSQSAAAIRYWKQEKTGGLYTVLTNLDTQSLIVLYTLDKLEGLFPYIYISALLQELNISPVVLPEICKQLAGAGLIVSETILRCTSSDITTELQNHLPPSQRQTISETAAHHLQRAIENGEIQVSPAILTLATATVPPDRLLDWYADLIQEYLWNNRLKEAHDMLYAGSILPGLRFTERISRRLQWILWAGRLQLAALQIDENTRQQLLASPPAPLNSALVSASDRGRVLLELARTAQQEKVFNRSILHAKNAIMAFQEAHHRKGLATAHTIIARSKLAEGRIREGLHYLQVASTVSGKQKTSIQHIDISSQLAAVYFLNGNYTRAAATAAEYIDLADRSGWESQALRLSSIQARTAFELGLYKTAIHRFNSCRSLARIYENTDAMISSASWAARSIGYQYSPSSALSILYELPENGENLLFTGEALLHMEEYSQAVVFLEQAIAKWEQQDQAVSHTDKSFFAIEALAIGQIEKDHCAPLLLAKTLHAFALFKLGNTDGIELLRTLMRTKALQVHDPQAPIYYSLYSQVLTEQETPEEDPNAIIGRAAKQLQERSAGIENPQQKIAYLHKNFWSRKLMQAAQKGKMV